MCCVLDKSLNEIGRLRMVKEVFEYPHSSIELNSSRKELGLLQGGTGIPRLTRFLVARFHFTRILEDVFYSI